MVFRTALKTTKKMASSAPKQVVRVKTQLVRFGVSLESGLLKKFDVHLQEKGYKNRSKAIADLIRKEFVASDWERGGRIAGAVSLVYDHHSREVVNKLLDLQHDFGEIIVSSQHIHLDHDNCLEIIAVRGDSEKVRELSDALGAVKGVKHAVVSAASSVRVV